MIKKSEMTATKIGGKWRINSDGLPLTESQRQALASRLGSAHEALDKALEPAAKAVAKAPATQAAAKESTSRQYSVTDLRVFQTGAEIYRQMVGELGESDKACQHLAAALALVSQGCHCFHPNDKARRFAEARDLLASITSELLLWTDDQAVRRRAFAERIEQEVIPKVGRLVAAQEKRTQRSRFDRFGYLSPRPGR